MPHKVRNYFATDDIIILAQENTVVNLCYKTVFANKYMFQPHTENI